MNTEKIAEKFRNDKKLILIIIIGLVGVLVLLFSGSSDDTENTAQSEENNFSANASLTVLSANETEKILAEKVENLVSQLYGAGEVTAEVSVSSSCEYIYAENVNSEIDSQYSSSEDREFVIYSDDAENGLLICIKNPEILGVAVICQGAESSVVRAEVTELVTSLFGIGSDKVYVGKKI